MFVHNSCALIYGTSQNSNLTPRGSLASPRSLKICTLGEQVNATLGYNALTFLLWGDSTYHCCTLWPNYSSHTWYGINVKVVACTFSSVACFFVVFFLSRCSGFLPQCQKKTLWWKWEPAFPCDTTVRWWMVHWIDNVSSGIWKLGKVQPCEKAVIQISVRNLELWWPQGYFKPFYFFFFNDSH